jgi:hypothetical protein
VLRTGRIYALFPARTDGRVGLNEMNAPLSIIRL